MPRGGHPDERLARVARIGARRGRGHQAVFVTYYLWWTNRHWHDRLGADYPYGESPSPLPATVGSNGCGSSSRYPWNRLGGVSHGLAYDQDRRLQAVFDAARKVTSEGTPIVVPLTRWGNLHLNALRTIIETNGAGA